MKYKVFFCLSILFWNQYSFSGRGIGENVDCPKEDRYQDECERLDYDNKSFLPQELISNIPDGNVKTKREELQDLVSYAVKKRKHENSIKSLAHFKNRGSGDLKIDSEEKAVFDRVGNKLDPKKILLGTIVAEIIPSDVQGIIGRYAQRDIIKVNKKI